MLAGGFRFVSAIDVQRLAAVRIAATPSLQRAPTSTASATRAEDEKDEGEHVVLRRGKYPSGRIC
jgi:hypothetical protein